MDVFRLRDSVVSEYRDYVESFVNVLDLRVNQFVRERLADGHLWPDAVLQLNPAFEQASTFKQLSITPWPHGQRKRLALILTKGDWCAGRLRHSPMQFVDCLRNQVSTKTCATNDCAHYLTLEIWHGIRLGSQYSHFAYTNFSHPAAAFIRPWSR